MAVKILGGAALWALLAASASQGESLAQLGGPANPPPGSFRGQQFVDSRGCLFLRAGFGGGVNWVARVDRKHRPICGMMPTGSAAAQTAVAADMAPDPLVKPTVQAPVTMAQPAPVQRQPGQGLAWLFGTPRQPGPAPVASPVPAPVAQTRAHPPALGFSGVTTLVPGVQCYDNTPVLQRVQISGGTALVCTRGDGSSKGWRSPMAVNPPTAQAAMAPVPRMVVPVVRNHALPKPPTGWTYAWKDDRLNPLRGVGTAEGQAQQDQLWTRTVPMMLIANPVAARPVTVQTQVSTMSTPASGKVLIQVGSYGQTANAKGTASKIAALGLPASTANLTQKGKALQIVYAGPFATMTEAQAGLQALHAAGFADAFLR